MSYYLSKNNKKRLSIGYLLIVLFFAWYIYDTNKELQNSINHSQMNSILSDYKLYKYIFMMHGKIKLDILIKNDNYVNNNDLVDQFSKSSPFYINKENKQISKYNLTIKFFDTNKRQNIAIKNKVASLNGKDYIYEVKDSSIELFGKVHSNGYVYITKHLKHSSSIKETLDSFVVKIFIIGLLNIIIFLYILSLFDEHEKNKKRMQFEFEKLSEDAKAIAIIDTLTGANTRVKFNEDLEALIQLANRFKEQIFVFMILDIDNFKIVNDTHGHDYGDIVLKKVAHTIKEHIRETDYFYRWGGEEFVILMPMNNLQNSVDYANILRENIAQIKFEKLNRVTCSFGLVEFKKGDNETTIIKRADELLYKAKDKGRNRVEYENTKILT